MASESTPETRMRDQVFISYNHKDAEWMKKFSAQLSVIRQTGPSRYLERQEDQTGSELATGNRRGHCKSPRSTIACNARFLRVEVHPRRGDSQDPDEASGERA